MVRDHGEGLPLLTSLGRDDGGVQGEQIGLVVDPANHVDDLADFTDALRQSLEDLLRLQGLRADLGDPVDGGADRLRARLGALADRLGQPRCLADVLADLLNRPVHLDHGRGGLLRHALHRVGALGDLADAGADLVDRGGGGVDRVVERAGVARHLIDGASHLEDRRGDFVGGAREALDLGVDAADRGIDVHQQGGGFLDGLLGGFSAALDLRDRLEDPLRHLLQAPDDIGDPFADSLLGFAQRIQRLAVVGQIAEILRRQPRVEVTLGDLLDRLQSQADGPGDPFPERTLAYQSEDDGHGHPAAGSEKAVGEGKHHQCPDAAQSGGEQSEDTVEPCGDCLRLSHLGRVHGSVDLPRDTACASALRRDHLSR